MKFGLVIAVVYLAVSPSWATSAQGQPEYTQMETEDSFVYMDKEGLAVRMAKNWACRHQNWAPAAEPTLLLNRQQFNDFELRMKSSGQWSEWSCVVRPGGVTFSRDIQNAQRAMNDAAGKPDCAPRVPETGRLNWETLDYARCYVARDVKKARAAYDAALASRLAEVLRDGGGGLDRLVARAKAEELPHPYEGCGKMLSTVYDSVVCEKDRCDQLLKKAEGFFEMYRLRIDALRGSEAITQQQAQGIAGDADLVREYLWSAQRAADGL